MKKLVLFFFIIFFYSACDYGTAYVFWINNETNLYLNIKIKEIGIDEEICTVQPKSHIDCIESWGIGNFDLSASEILEYLKVYDNNNQEIMNLSGSALDSKLVLKEYYSDSSSIIDFIVMAPDEPYTNDYILTVTNDDLIP